MGVRWLESGCVLTDEAPSAVTPGGLLDVFVYGEATREDLIAAGATVRTTAGRVSTVFISLDDIARVAAVPTVAAIVGTGFMAEALDYSVPAIGLSTLRGSAPYFSSANGSGVVIGVIDTGVDFSHPDFLGRLGATRLLSIWDQTSSSGPSPVGFTYGREWTQAQIDAGACTEVDTNGHGTAVLAIAGGDGSATGNGEPAFQYVGVAPRANLVVVKVDSSFPYTSVLDGIEYVFNLAATRGQSAVVNLSAGYNVGPHDGTSLMETAIDALSGPGRVFVASAHNWRSLPWHAEIQAGSAQSFARVCQSNCVTGRLVHA